jgi:hypothetical protein
MATEKSHAETAAENSAAPRSSGGEPPTMLACRCGAVAFEVRGAPVAQFYCHCDDCQAVHGAAYVGESAYPADAVRVVRGEPLTWRLKRNPRFTCGACGTRLFIDVGILAIRGVNAALLPKAMFQPTFHMQCKFAVAPVKDDLPHYASRPARFGGSDETIGW